MLNLIKSNKYQEEMTRFKAKAASIKIPATKKQVDKLILDLEEQVKIISDAHNGFLGVPIDPKSVHENIEICSKIRWRLKSLLRC